MPENQAADGEVVYRVRADTSDLKKDLKESEQAARRSAGTVENTLGVVEDAAEEAADSMAGAMREAAEAIADAADAAAESAEGLGESADGASDPVKGFGDETEKTRKKTKSFAEELDDINELLEKNSKNAVLTAQKKKVLAEAVEQTTRELDDLKEKQQEVDRAYQAGEIPDEEYRAFQRQIIATEQELQNYREELEKVGKASEEVAEKTEGGLSDALSSVGGALGTAGKVAGGTVLAVGAAVVAGGVAAVNVANDLDKAMNSFTASTDVAVEDMDRYRAVMEDIYTDNFGENFEDIAASLALVRKNLGDMNDADLTRVTEAAIMLNDTFEYDIVETTRAAKAMMDSFGINGYNAMGLIAAGAQNGLDYSDELIDSISEYSVQFAKFGFTADDMFHIMEKGAESGAWSLDKIGDAVKELSIRAIDGSDGTTAGFEAVGLSADAMSAKFALGGDAAKTAFYETVEALGALDDPLAQNTAGVALFGSMWEDLGTDAVTALNEIGSGIYNTEDALGKINEVKYDDLGSMFEALSRTLEMVILPIGEALIPVLNELLEEILPLLENSLGPIAERFLDLIDPILTLAKEAIEPLAAEFEKLVSGELLPYLIETLLPELKNIGESLKPFFEEFKTDILPRLTELLTGLSKEILTLITDLLPPLLDVVMALLPVFLDLAEMLIPILVDILRELAPVIQDLVPIIELLAEYLGISLKAAIEMVMPVIEDCMEIIAMLGDSWAAAADLINAIIEGDWKTMWASAGKIFENAMNGLPMIAETVLNLLVGMLNASINGINMVTGKFGIDAIPNIPVVKLPKFHTGGIIDYEMGAEVPILAQSGEMVLTQAQQRRLFEIANGLTVQPEKHLSALDPTDTVEGEQPVVNYYIQLQVGEEIVADAVTTKVDMQQGVNLVLKQRGLAK
ncbi:MAG: hypothetical protein E7511_05855 [Ruminococcus sp.]|nr:hypothetical protein [Ruminococcus sp.]